MIGTLFLIGGVAMAAVGFWLLRRFDVPTQAIRVTADGKPVKPLAGPVQAGSVLGIAAGYVALLGGLSVAVVGAAILMLG